MNISDIESLIPAWLAHSSLYAVVVTNLEGYCLYTNEVFKKNFVQNRDVIGLLALETIHQDDASKCEEAIRKCLQNPHQPVSIFLRKSHQGNYGFYLTQWEFSVLFDAKNNPVGIVCVGFDVSPINEAQRQLKASENKLRAIIDSTNDNNILLAPDYTVLSFNKAAKENIRHFFGAEIEEGQDFRQYVVESRMQDFKQFFERAMAGETIKEELEIKIDDQHSIWFLISFYPVFDGNNQLIGVSYNASDIDKAKKSELLLKKQNEALKEIAYLQSHEIRKLVANILGLVELLETGTLSEENKAIFDLILEEVCKLDKIIYQIVHRIQKV